MRSRWLSLACADTRSFLWLGSGIVHAAMAAVILTRAPSGFADQQHTRLAAAPQVELGLLPVPVSGETNETVPATEPPLPAEAQPEPTAMAALAPTPLPAPVQEPAPEDAIPGQKSDEPPPQAKPVKPVVQKTKPKPTPVRHAKPVPPREQATDRHATGSIAARASGTMSGAQADTAQSGSSRADYGVLLRAEIMRRRIYPPEAVSRGDQGTVMARVTIGPNGTAVSHAVVRGSGIAAFDQAVPRIMARLSLPPPPGGSYTATVAIRFALE